MSGVRNEGLPLAPVSSLSISSLKTWISVSQAMMCSNNLRGILLCFHFSLQFITYITRSLSHNIVIPESVVVFEVGYNIISTIYQYLMRWQSAKWVSLSLYLSVYRFACIRYYRLNTTTTASLLHCNTSDDSALHSSDGPKLRLKPILCRQKTQIKGYHWFICCALS